MCGGGGVKSRRLMACDSEMASKEDKSGWIETVGDDFGSGATFSHILSI